MSGLYEDPDFDLGRISNWHHCLAFWLVTYWLVESALTGTNLKSSQDSKLNRLGGRGFFRPNRGYSFVKNGIQGIVFLLSITPIRKLFGFTRWIKTDLKISLKGALLPNPFELHQTRIIHGSFFLNVTRLSTQKHTDFETFYFWPTE